MTTIDLSDAAPTRRSWWRSITLWTVAVAVYAVALSNTAHLPAMVALRESAIYLYLLALLMIPVGRLSERWMARERLGPFLVAKHGALALTTLAIWRGAIIIEDWVNVGSGFWDLIYARNWMFMVLFDAATYGTALGLILASQSLRRERERERREAELVIVAREAELSAIRAQFQPHFVLNALNSLLALIDKEPALARTMVVRLADLMKAVFDRLDSPAVPLERELDLARAYLDIERIRFGSRLTVAFDIEDAARGVPVPPFLLQPLVENAVKHGIAPYARGGEVRVSAHLDGARLAVVVHDSGGSEGRGAPGIVTPSGSGRGLHLTRRRLETIYGNGYELTLDRQITGTSVRVTLPAGSAHAA